MIVALLKKQQHKEKMQQVDAFPVTAAQGIDGQVLCSPFRQVLILEQKTLFDFDVQPGDLRENIIIDDHIDLYNLPSGTVIQIGDVKIRLTFLCEPCKVIADKVNLKHIHGKRGMLGCFLNDGVIQKHDKVFITDKKLEFIPEKASERIAWFLDKRNEPIMARDLMWQVGLPQSYCRALPAIIAKNPAIDGRKILFANQI
jgi:MOSC domain-containing protein YiiM